MNTLTRRIRRSAEVVDSSVTTLGDVRAQLEDSAAAQRMRVSQIAFSEMRGWRFAPDTRDLVHESGRFFSVEGLHVQMPDGAVPEWSQPILHQPETAILGVLAKEFDGVLHFLMQAKAEPGNHRLVQISPTVQATRSNYTQVHKGRPVPYVEYFRQARGESVLVDVRLSEQGSWFYHKRNRNVVVEVPPEHEVESQPGYYWLTLGQLHRLLAEDDLLNMDARSVLACLPYSSLDPEDSELAGGTRASGSVHGFASLLTWLNLMRGKKEGQVRLVPLGSVDGWCRLPDRISHESGRFFDIVAVEVEAYGREVASWTQPLLAPRGTGVAGFLLRYVDGVPHVLVQARAEPGYVDGAELGPTVQFNPLNQEVLPPSAAQPLIDEILKAPPERVLFDTLLSEEGGRFRHALNRYLIVEADPAGTTPEPESHRWIAVHQIVELMRHSGYVNVEARTLVAALNSLRR
jgi:oxidase EvaA